MKIKQFLKTNVMAIAALLLFTGSIMSFTLMEKKSVLATTYFYNSTDISAGAFANPSHWQTINDDVSCEVDGERPCNIVVPDGQTLGSVLAGKTNVQVLSMSPSRKP